jgi:hypothetical protein
MSRYTLILLGTLWATAGCTSMDLVGRRLDMVSEHIGSEKPVYEGRIESARRVGPLVALEFTDGKDFDVSDCPLDFVAGDDVRIYQTEKGYAAHLWHATADPLKS